MEAVDLERTAELLTRLREVWEQLYFTLKLGVNFKVT